MKKETDFQKDLKKELRILFPNCIIQKNDPNEIQGIPDLVIHWGQYYAFLECKRSIKEIRQPNQRYYINLINEWSYAAFIYPENKEEVLYELQRAFGIKRPTRIS